MRSRILSVLVMKTKIKKLIKLGEDVDGNNIPVLNEQEIRAAGGILLLTTFTSLMFFRLKENFVLIKYVITLYLTDFMIRIVINPEFSPTPNFGYLIVRHQTSEYLGAAQ